MKSQGGMLWACKNYDGDVMSDMLASAFGSLALMSSVLVSPRGCFMYEAAHGTVQRHYYQYQAGKKTSTNPMALIFTWSSAIKKRGQMDGTPDVIRFGEALETASLETIESGTMTGDLVALAAPNENNQRVDSEAFLLAIRSRLESTLKQTG